MEVERVEPEPVVERDQAAGEEVLPHEGHSPGVGRDDRRPLRRPVVGAAVRRARPAVDDPAGAEPARRLRPGHRPHERPAPQTLGRDRAIEHLQVHALRHCATLRLRVGVRHPRRHGEALDRELPRRHRHLAGELSRLEPGLQHGQTPRLAAGLHVEVEPDECGVTPRVGKERERAVADRALHDGRLRAAAHVKPRNVADARARGMPANGEAVGGAGGQRKEG